MDMEIVKSKLHLLKISSKSQICQKDKVKFLGIVIDKSLKWKLHIDKLTTHLFKSVKMLYI